MFFNFHFYWWLWRIENKITTSLQQIVRYFWILLIILPYFKFHFQFNETLQSVLLEIKHINKATKSNSQPQPPVPVLSAPVKSMSLSSTEPHHHRMAVTCKAEGMYPEPEVSLLVQRSRFKRWVPAAGARGWVSSGATARRCEAWRPLVRHPPFKTRRSRNDRIKGVGVLNKESEVLVDRYQLSRVGVKCGYFERE